MIAPELDSLRPSNGPGFSDAVTVAFGDADTKLYGLVRVGVTPGSPARASGIALLFSGREVAAARAVPAVDLAEPGYAPPELGGLGVETVERLARWRARFADRDGGFDLDVTALGPPLTFGEEGDPAGELATTDGYEQLCRVEGVVRAGGAERRVACFGQRGHTWGATDWERVALLRAVSVWLGEEGGLTLAAARPAAAKAHDDEAISALLAEPVEDGLASRPVAEPRLSTAYDGEGRQRRAGLELWESEEADYPRRASGEVVCGTSLSLGRLRLDCAFFRWHLDGRPGVGRYDILRRAA